MDWAPQDRTTLHVVDLRDGSRKVFRAPPCFVFHWANAWESEDGRCAAAALVGSASYACNLQIAAQVQSWHTAHVNRLRSLSCPHAPLPSRYLHLDACLYEDPQICNDLYLEPLRADFARGSVPGRAYLRRATIDLQAADGGWISSLQEGRRGVANSSGDHCPCCRCVPPACMLSRQALPAPCRLGGGGRLAAARAG